MNEIIKKVGKDIRQGENLERNLPWVFNRLINLYDKNAKLKLAMNYYTFYESYREEILLLTNIACNQSVKEDNKDHLNNQEHNLSQEDELLNEVNKIISNFLNGDFSGEYMESSVKHLDQVRNTIIDRMNILTCYTDLLQIYEYVLNRIEYRYKKELEDINNEEFVAEVLTFIFGTKDNMIINERIKDVIGQLPVRMTKTKYYELLGNSISLYKDGDCSSLDTYIYMLKTSAAIYHPEGMDLVFPELTCLKEDLENADYKNLSEKEYIDFVNRLQNGAGVIRRNVNFYYGLQEIVNYLYVIILAWPYADTEESNSTSFDSLSVIREINHYFDTLVKEPLPRKLEEKFEKTEGMQEAYFEEINLLEPIYMDIKTNYSELVNSLMLRSIFQTINTAIKLSGSSIFVDLNQSENMNKVDEAYLNQAKDELISLLSNIFKERTQLVNRAIMANTLNKMPVFFQTYEEIKEYMMQSLDQCHDLAEKIASVQLIKSVCEN